MRHSCPAKTALWVFILLLPSLVFAAVKSGSTKQVKTVDSGYWPGQYDTFFKKYSKRYFGPSFNWRWFKSQGIAESALNPKARSHVGAQGVMQIMPATFAEIKKSNPYFSSVYEPRWNIAAAIYYNRQNYRKWIKRVKATDDRMAFTFASYNAGLGNALKAWKRGGKDAPDGKQWQKAKKHAPSETRGYVARINRLMGK